MLAEIQENCGWDLAVADDVAEIAPPTLDELKSVRMFDPHSFFLGKGDLQALPGLLNWICLLSL